MTLESLGEEGTKKLQLCRERILRKINKAGVLAFDIETVTNTQRSNGEFTLKYGNALPVILCAVGSLNVLTDKLTADTKTSYTLLENVDKVFVGYNCVEQFVEWLLQVRAIFDKPPSVLASKTQEQLSSAARRSSYLAARTNYLVAHNGARFDFRFLMDAITTIANVSILGDTTKMKSLSFKNIVLTDSFLLLPFSLAKLCTMLGTKHQKMQDFDVTRLTMESWQGKELQQEAVAYCRMDCLALRDVYLTYVRVRATTYYGNRAFPAKIFPVTQSSAALDVFRNCYLEKTINAASPFLEQERSSYMGGISLVYGTKLSLGLSCDINSSYPASMHNLMPTEPTEVRDYTDGSHH